MKVWKLFKEEYSMLTGSRTLRTGEAIEASQYLSKKNLQEKFDVSLLETRQFLVAFSKKNTNPAFQMCKAHVHTAILEALWDFSKETTKGYGEITGRGKSLIAGMTVLEDGKKIEFREPGVVQLVYGQWVGQKALNCFFIMMTHISLMLKHSNSDKQKEEVYAIQQNILLSCFDSRRPLLKEAKQLCMQHKWLNSYQKISSEIVKIAQSQCKLEEDSDGLHVKFLPLLKRVESEDLEDSEQPSLKRRRLI